MPYTKKFGPFALSHPGKQLPAQAARMSETAQRQTQESVSAQQIAPGANKCPTERLKIRPVSLMEC